MPEERELENTELIDVSDISANFGDELETVPGGETSEPIPVIAEPSEPVGPPVAGIRDRFAAFVIDALFLYLIYWPAMIIYRSIAMDSPAGPIPAADINGVIFHGIFLIITLMWFVIPEFAFSASVGKLLCHITVRKWDGSFVSFPSVLVRNLIRPLDLIFFPLFIVSALMEWTNWHRRIGDILGGTVVLKNLTTPPHQYALSLDMLSSASRRVAAFAIDFLLVATFAFGLGLMLTPEAPLASMILVVVSPVIIIILFILPEWIAKTSPGKWVFGLTVCMEDGSAIDLSSAVIRTLWRIFDTNPFGFLTCLFSIRRQRPGDVAAGTVVIRTRREWKGLVGLAALFFIATITLYAGTQNRDSFLSRDFKINFLPSISAEAWRKEPISEMQPNLLTRNFHFAAGDSSNTRMPPTFEPGETLYIIFDVNGYRRDETKVWLQEDLDVNYPDGSAGLKLENINDFNKEVTQEGPIRFENSIEIPQNAQVGRYSVTITIRDKLSSQELKEQRFFYIVRPESEPLQGQPPKGETPEGGTKDTTNYDTSSGVIQGTP